MNWIVYPNFWSPDNPQWCCCCFWNLANHTVKSGSCWTINSLMHACPYTSLQCPDSIMSRLHRGATQKCCMQKCECGYYQSVGMAVATSQSNRQWSGNQQPPGIEQYHILILTHLAWCIVQYASHTLLIHSLTSRKSILWSNNLWAGYVHHNKRK